MDATRKQHIQAISEFTGKEQQARRELEKVRHHVHDLALVQKEIWEELKKSFNSAKKAIFSLFFPEKVNGLKCKSKPLR